MAREEGDRLPPTRPAPDRRVADEPHPHATQIGPGTYFRGDLSCSDPVEIRGTLEGDCRTSARCVVHEGGRVLGNIDAAALIVAGRVEAGVLKADKVELRASAKVEGTIEARVVVIADGAFYKGGIEGTAAPGGSPFLKDRRHGSGGAAER